MMADVQVPDAEYEGGWRTVGRLDDLPMAPAVNGDGGISIRRAGLPFYFVPRQFRGTGVTYLTADWLGFEASSVRLARLANYESPFHPRRFGLCHICLLYTSPSPRDS